MRTEPTHMYDKPPHTKTEENTMIKEEKGNIYEGREMRDRIEIKENEDLTVLHSTLRTEGTDGDIVIITKPDQTNNTYTTTQLVNMRKLEQTKFWEIIQHLSGIDQKKINKKINRKYNKCKLGN